MTAPVFEKGYPSYEAVNSLDIWERVIEQIKEDFEAKDETAIYAMLQSVPRSVLTAYLPEEDSHEHLREGDGD
tara:strand:- start:375 stop:593 length:219 start_codon:yes stop_codon:yes gene_type:complete